MFKFMRIVRRKLYNFIVAEAEVSASNWFPSSVTPCVFCQRPVRPYTVFCSHCGKSQTHNQDTTASMLRLTVTPAPVSPANVAQPVNTLTQQLMAAAVPGQEHAWMKAHRRLQMQEYKKLIGEVK